MERHIKIGKYPFTDSEVAELREYFGEQIAKEIEAYEVTKENGIGIQMMAAKIARGQANG